MRYEPRREQDQPIEASDHKIDLKTKVSTAGSEGLFSQLLQSLVALAESDKVLYFEAFRLPLNRSFVQSYVRHNPK